MTLLEKVAKAHYDRRTTHNRTFIIEPRWRDLSERDKERELVGARAAITALRDAGVSDEMWEAYSDMDAMGGSSDLCFRAMLDAVLEDK